jgi:hypothetical protein
MAGQLFGFDANCLCENRPGAKFNFASYQDALLHHFSGVHVVCARRMREQPGDRKIAGALGDVAF